MAASREQRRVRGSVGKKSRIGRAVQKVEDSRAKVWRGVVGADEAAALRRPFCVEQGRLGPRKEPSNPPKRSVEV